jgi:hypothetical protein
VVFDLGKNMGMIPEKSPEQKILGSDVYVWVLPIRKGKKKG